MNPNPNGRKPALSAEQPEAIRHKLDAQPDITLREHIEDYSLPVSAQALCSTINKKLGLCRKKTAHALERQRPDVVKQRSEWKAKQNGLEADRLVSWTNSYPSRNPLIKEDGYTIPASGMDSIMDSFPLVGRRVSCLLSA
jgi:hypothetical protein